MIPRLETGRSFRGAALYYLHDKKKEGELLRLTDERVAWTATRNCVHDDPELAIQEMIATCQMQAELKRQNGLRPSGNCREPVITVSLSWHPVNQPPREAMEAAADDYLRFMGWSEHQAVYLSHNDTAHSHVHIILNKVHPERGLVLDQGWTKDRTVAWRDQYQRELGLEWTKENDLPDRDRHKGPRGLPYRDAIMAREMANSYAELEYVAARIQQENEAREPHKGPRGLPHRDAIEARRTPDRYGELEHVAVVLEREQLRERHHQEREAFLATGKEEMRDAIKLTMREVRREFKGEWHDYYTKAKTERQELREDAELTAAHVMTLARGEDFNAALATLVTHDQQKKEFANQLRAERDRLSEAQANEIKDRCAACYKDVVEDRNERFDTIKTRQKEERAELKELQTARETGQPYDEERLKELVRVPTPAQLRGDQQALEQGAREFANENYREEAIAVAEQERPALEAKVSEKEEENVREASSERAPRRDAADLAAGAIGKVAEVVAEVMSALFTPDTPRDKALREARAELEAEMQPVREAVREAETQRERQAANARQKSIEERLDDHFSEHGARIRWQEEQRQKKKDRDYER